MRLVADLGLTNRVKFGGGASLEAIADVMANADLGVVPKRADGFGNEAYSTKIMEFMSQGVPVIASRTKIDEFYFDDSTIQFFAAGDHESMCRAMLAVIEDGDRREHEAQRLLGLRGAAGEGRPSLAPPMAGFAFMERAMRLRGRSTSVTVTVTRYDPVNGFVEGTFSGSVMLKNTLRREAPNVRAASSRPLSMASIDKRIARTPFPDQAAGFSEGAVVDGVDGDRIKLTKKDSGEKNAKKNTKKTACRFQTLKIKSASRGNRCRNATSTKAC